MAKNFLGNGLHKTMVGRLDSTDCFSFARLYSTVLMFVCLIVCCCFIKRDEMGRRYVLYDDVFFMLLQLNMYISKKLCFSDSWFFSYKVTYSRPIFYPPLEKWTWVQASLVICVGGKQSDFIFVLK